MAPPNIWRIAALVASIVICMALALGACISKRTEVKEAKSGHTGTPADVNQPYPVTRSDKRSGASADAGAGATPPSGPGPRRAEPQPKKPRTSPKGHTGMLRQMHLQGGE
jgi:hypothetical protein